MGQASSSDTSAGAVSKFMRPVFEEYVNIRDDLETAHCTVIEQQDIIEQQAATIRVLETKIATLQFALSVAIGENDSILHEARVMKEELQARSADLENCVRELSDAKCTIESMRTQRSGAQPRAKAAQGLQ